MRRATTSAHEGERDDSSGGDFSLLRGVPSKTSFDFFANPKHFLLNKNVRQRTSEKPRGIERGRVILGGY